MQVSKQLLKKKPFIYFGLSCSLLIIVGSSLFISGMFRENQTVKKNELSAITQLKTEQLVGWYDERYADAITIASSPFIVDATAALIKGNAGGSKSAIEKYLQNICKHYGYTSAFIAAPHGKLLLGTDPSIKVFDTKTRSRLYVAIRDRQVISSDFYYCLIHRRVHLDFIAPIIDPEQKVIGTLVLRVAPDEVLFPMLGAWPLPSRSGETILFRQDGDSIVYLNNLRFRPDAAFKMHYPLTAIDNPAVQSLSGRTGVMEGRDYRDVPVLAYIVPVPGTNWFLETKIDKSEIYAEVRIRAGFRIINMILALILVITGLAFIYNSRQKEVYKSLYKEEVKLHQLEEQFRTILYSIGDAVIVTNQEAVIQYLNPVAEQLTGWSEAEGRGRHLTEVFHIVNEESHAEVENPVEQVLQKGLVFNLANHTLLITRDGREIPIADSGAPIKDQAGKLSGVVLVFRDQTAEREAQRAIQRSEMQFRSIWESSRDGMRLSDSEGIIIKVNPAFCELVGLKAEQLEGQPISMIYSADTGPRILARHKERVHGGMLPSYLVRQMTLHDGRKCWFEVSNTMVNLDGQNLVLNIFRDITARKQLETELSRSEAELKALFAAMHDVVMVADIEGRILKIAQTNSDLLYRPTAEVIGKSLTEIFPPEYCQLFLGKIQQTLQTQSEVRFDYNLPIQDQVLWFEATLTPLTADSVLLVARDITDRKRVEAALQASENRYRAIFEGSKDAMMILEPPDWRFTSGNPAILEVFGVDSVAQFLNYTPWEWSPEYQPDGSLSAVKAREMIQKAMDEGTHYFEWLHERRDGESFIATVLLNRIDLDNKSFLVATVRDISKHRKVEEALSLSEHRYVSLIEASPAGIFRTDIHGSTTFVSQRWCQISGVEARDAQGNEWLKAVHPEDRVKIISHWETAVRNQKQSVAEYRFIRPDGTIRWVRGHAAPETDATGQIIGYIGVIIDITEEKKAELALQESEERYRRLTENAEDMIFRFELLPERRVTYISPAVTKIFGYTPEDHYADPDLCLKIVHPEDRPMCEAMLAGRSRKVELVTMRWIHKNGDMIWTEQKNVPIFNAQGDLVAIEGVSRDITERKRIEEALHLQDLQLRQAQKMEALGQLASGIAHDFNNILGIIMGHASLVKRDFKGPEKIQQSIDTIEKTSQRGADLVKRLLTLARKSEPVTAPINLQEMMAEMGNLLRETFPKNITIEVKIASLLPYILADASQIHQVLMNLCINARDAMPQGGKLTLSADTVERVHLLSRFAEAQASSYVLLEVSDTGVGIEPQVIERIFDPFYTTKERGKGTGLGLATVHSIVRNHNGYIDVESTPGQGTTFRLYLPVPSLEGIEIQTPEETTTSAGHGQETILLIEDEDYIAELIAATLKAYGYRPLIARDGSEGVNLFRQHQSEVNLVITDMGLPGIMGDEVFRQIKALEPQIPIIIASGYIDPEHKNELLAAGLAQFIQKPYLPEELVKKVREALDKV